MKVGAAILAAGRGERFGRDKILASLGGKPVWRWSFDAFCSHPRVAMVGLVGSEENLPQLQDPRAAFLVGGGDTRQASSLIGASHLESCDVVLVHDGARPFVSTQLISKVIAGVERSGAAAPALPAVDTLRMKEPCGYRLLDRDKVVALQTPQGCLRENLLRAHRLADRPYTDELGLLQAAGFSFELVQGDVRNFKVTTPEDLLRAEAMLGSMETRTGLGYDIHAYSCNPHRPCVLGGVLFENEEGLEGHSDADVVIHALVDALLGAAALGDIGQHFPNSDTRWRGEPSTTFLRHAVNLLSAAGWRVVNADVAVMAERPKIMPRADEIRSHLAKVIGIDVDRVSIKATTNEGLGAIGRGEGIAALATASISRFAVQP